MKILGGSWQITVDSHKFNPVVTLIIAAVLNVVSLLEHSDIATCTWAVVV
jgi:hypothetical protein